MCRNECIIFTYKKINYVMKHSLSLPFFDPVVLFLWFLFTLLLLLRHIFVNKSNYETPEIKRKNDEKLSSMYSLSANDRETLLNRVLRFDFS